jgi:hypothetical protein
MGIFLIFHIYLLKFGVDFMDLDFAVTYIST